MIISHHPSSFGGSRVASFFFGFSWFLPPTENASFPVSKLSLLHPRHPIPQQFVFFPQVALPAFDDKFEVPTFLSAGAPGEDCGVPLVVRYYNMF